MDEQTNIFYHFHTKIIDDLLLMPTELLLYYQMRGCVINRTSPPNNRNRLTIFTEKQFNIFEHWVMKNLSSKDQKERVLKRFLLGWANYGCVDIENNGIRIQGNCLLEYLLGDCNGGSTSNVIIYSGKTQWGDVDCLYIELEE